MKYFIKLINIIFFIIFNVSLLLSCTMLYEITNGSQSWNIFNDSEENNYPALLILNINVDVNSNKSSIEKEAASLIPLFFWNDGYKVVSADEKPEFAAIIYLREREANFAWENKKSLAVEVHIWKYDDDLEEESLVKKNSIYEQKLPEAVGRTISTGRESFSSSTVTGKMLSKTISLAVKNLKPQQELRDNE